MNTYNCTEQINHDDETHRETTEAKKFRQEHKLTKIVYSRIDPATTLREQHAPRLGSDGVRDGIRRELGPERREVLEEQRR